ncbi:hypothetical protein FisN_30Lh091 [Fistulifera solaris]|uniref:Sulfotransferase domain-containing protein n=1 Tax=Fistulifera solaris TaxID=1519565 RepID=A0A1Z5JIN6_FISSO|nr:hypothetical protein FisN_30Lh091 [Fistulifera solaris]|eukprot:GAX13796.1 hypothetical protein FisN_30Lh091 [Fistulifera solaris]
MRAILPRIVGTVAIAGMIALRSRSEQGFVEHRVEKAVTDKPLRLVFHVGPGKMGSSTLQKALLMTTLPDDGWISYSHIQLGALNRCLARKSCKSHQIDQFRAFVHQAEQDRRHIVLSTETWFSVSNELRWYQELFRNTLYQVTMVVAYRRYYDWLPSRYYQLNRFRCRPNPANKGRNNVNLGRPIPPLHKYLSHTPFDHPTVRKIERVSRYFDRIEVINIERGNLLEQFFCEILDATETCQRLQAGHSPFAVNQGETLSFDRLAQYLIEHDLVNSSQIDELLKELQIKVPNYGKASKECAALSLILEEQEKQNHDLKLDKASLVCPSWNVTDRLFSFSAETERALFPQDFSYETMWNDFASKLNTTSFCDVDLQALIIHNDGFAN